ncbi:MAG: hypothetical protein J6B32_00940 [Spirochaetaceae bacterium]|nr:hypothetical protein [Spirochaetaceae bacterium]
MKIKAEKKQRKKVIIYTLTNRTVIFLSTLLIVTFLLFIVGNLTNFTDRNLLLILTIIQIISVPNLIFCVASIIQSIFFCIKNKDTYYLFFILPSFLSLILTFVFFVFSGTLKVISLGSM